MDRCGHDETINIVVSLVWLGSQSAVTVRRIHQQVDLLYVGEGVEPGQTAGDQQVPPVDSKAQQVHLQLTLNYASLV